MLAVGRVENQRIKKEKGIKSMGAVTEHKLKCRQCQKEFKAVRKDARFCGETCRWTHWKAKQGAKPGTTPENSQKEAVLLLPKFMEELKGIIPDEPQYEEKETKEVNRQWWNLATERSKLSGERDKLKKAMAELKQREADIKTEKGNWWVPIGVIGGALGGGYLGGQRDEEDFKKRKAKSQSKTKPVEKSDSGKIWGGLIGAISLGLISYGINELTKEEREVKKKKALEEVNAHINQHKQLIQNYDTAIAELQQRMDVLPKWIIKKEKVLVPLPDLKTESEGFLKQTAEIKNDIASNENTVQLKEDNFDKANQKSSGEGENLSGRIISSEQFIKMNYKALHFKEQWAYFFGYPSVNFHCVLHGLSGSGKSTLAIQFAKYLAENFGKIIYITSEEGFSKTFKDKIVRNNASHPNFHVSNYNLLEDILQNVPADKYHFIFVDSLNDMRIDADGMKQLREKYKDSALITICQSTKDGKMRGSYEIIHDSDMAVKVHEGLATTTKNRFKETGTEIKVFEKTEEKSLEKRLKGTINDTLL